MYTYIAEKYDIVVNLVPGFTSFTIWWIFVKCQMSTHVLILPVSESSIDQTIKFPSCTIKHFAAKLID